MFKPMDDQSTPLKQTHRIIRDAMAPGFQLPIAHAMSWLQAAQQAADEDTALYQDFIRKWIRIIMKNSEEDWCAHQYPPIMNHEP